MAIPWEAILAVEGAYTGDGRLLAERSIRWGDGPWALTWEPTGSHRSPVIGSTDRVWRSGNEIRGAGTLDNESRDPRVVRAVSRVRELADKGVAGISVVLDDEALELRIKAAQIRKMMAQWKRMWDESSADREKRIKAWLDNPDSDGYVVAAKMDRRDRVMAIVRGRLRENTVTHIPAIIETQGDGKIQAVGATGGHWTPGSALRVLSAVAASSGMDLAFVDPRFGEDGESDPRLVWQEPMRVEEVGHWACPLVVEDDGRIYGHLFGNGRCHGGRTSCLVGPNSGGNFDRFLTGQATPGVRTGPIVMGTTHGVNPDGTVKSDDWLANTGAAVADITVGNDRHGTWVAGRLRPGVTPAQLAAVRGGALSGEWRPYGEGLLLAGVLVVNGPGFVVTRKEFAIAASGGGINTLGPACEPCGPDHHRIKLGTALTRTAARAHFASRKA